MESVSAVRLRVRTPHYAVLYAHPMVPVQDLMVTLSSGGPLLQFSGDSNLTYTVEATTDLQQWQSMGTPTAGILPGMFQFQDAGAGTAPARFYRVMAH